MTTCKNCGHQFELDYCNKCGQKASVKRIEMKWLLHDLPHAIWHLDKGILYNFKQLNIRPGYAIADYINGKRKYFFNPVSYLLLGFALNYFAIHFLHFKYFYKYPHNNYPDWWNEFILQYNHDNILFQVNYPFLLVLGLPFCCIANQLWLRLKGRRYNLAESFVVIAFISGQFQFIQGCAYVILAILKINLLTWIVEALLILLLVLILFPRTLSQLIITGKNKFLNGVWAVAGTLIYLLIFQVANQVIIWLTTR